MADNRGGSTVGGLPALSKQYVPDNNIGKMSGNTLTQSSISDDGSTVTVGNKMSVTTFAGGNIAGVVANASETQLTTTSSTNICSFTPTAQDNFLIFVYYRVVTGTTNVTIQITYNDASGAQTNTVLNAQSSAVGSYSCLPVFINATTGAAIIVKATGSVANQVYVSATVLEV
jgi:hypothetical protein